MLPQWPSAAGLLYAIYPDPDLGERPLIVLGVREGMLIEELTSGEN